MPVLSGKRIAVDVEATGLSVWHGDRPFAFPMCNEHGEMWYLEVDVNPATRQPVLSSQNLRDLRSVCSNRRIIKIFQNAPYDIRMLKSVGVEVRGRVEDVMFKSHASNTKEQGYNLKYLSYKYLDVPYDEQDELLERVRDLQSVIGDDPELKWNLNDKVYGDYWLPRMYKKLVDSDYEHADVCERYALLDVECTMGLDLMYESVMDELGVRKTVNKELDLMPVVGRMVDRGACVDLEVIKDQIKYTRNVMLKEKRNLREKLKWPDYNPNSTKQVQKVLYQILKFPVTYKAGKRGRLPEPIPYKQFLEEHPGKNASSNWQALTPYANHPIISSQLRYNSAAKAYAFFTGYRDKAVRDTYSDGYAIHGNFNQCKAGTGRFTSTDPNMQNIPYGMTAKSRGVVPFSARTPWKPRPGYVWLLADYKQLEARLFADCAREPFMLRAFNEGRDFHSECCNKAWGGKGNPGGVRSVKYVLAMDSRGVIPDEDVLNVWKEYKFRGYKERDNLLQGIPLSDHATSDADRVARQLLKEFDWDVVRLELSVGQEVSRNRAKCLLFCRIFGGGARAAMDLIQCSYEEAKQFMKDYSKEFPRIDEFISEMLEVGKAQGFIRNRAGRRLTVERGFEYRAVNHFIQSLAADLLKRAMRRSAEYFMYKNYDAHILFTIHDELIFEVHESLLNGQWEDRTEQEEGKTKKYVWTDCPLIQKIRRLMENNAGWVNIDTPVEFDMVKVNWDHKIPLKVERGNSLITNS